MAAAYGGRVHWVRVATWAGCGCSGLLAAQWDGIELLERWWYRMGWSLEVDGLGFLMFPGLL